MTKKRRCIWCDGDINDYEGGDTLCVNCHVGLASSLKYKVSSETIRKIVEPRIKENLNILFCLNLEGRT